MPYRQPMNDAKFMLLAIVALIVIAIIVYFIFLRA